MIFERRHHVDGKATPAAFGGKKLRRAGSAHAEVEVKPDHGAAHREPLDQDAADEVGRGQMGQRSVEGKHDRAVESGRRQQPQFGGLVGQPEQRLAGIEESARMRLESQRRGRLAQSLGAAARNRNHRLVAAMHAIEIADGDDRPAQAVTGRVVAHDDEAVGRHPAAMVKTRQCPSAVAGAAESRERERRWSTLNRH